MFVRKRAIKLTRRHHRSRRYYGLSVKDALQFISSMILPLMLGVFTVIITFQQQKLFRDQRLEDMQTARQQRLEDKNESRLQRELDWNITKSNQEAQSKAAVDRNRDEVLVTYTKEIGDLLKENNGLLIYDALAALLARVKTLNVLRQLDGPRQLHVIRFLYEAGQLTDTNQALDITSAVLTDIDIQKSLVLQQIEKMSLSGVFIQNCTFIGIFLKEFNFASTWFINADFSSTHLSNVNFSPAVLQNVKFLSASLIDVTFSSAHLENVNFSSARLFNVTFSSARFVYDLSKFHHAEVFYTIFAVCQCKMADFSYAILSMSMFEHANVMGVSFHRADLTGVNFYLANLQKADLTNTTITDRQLQSALSIRDAKLPNGTLGLGRNLIKNGAANCNISLVDYWQVLNGNIVVVSKEDGSKCQFTLQSIATGATMSQRIDLINVWNSTIWTRSKIELYVHLSSGVSIELSASDSNGTILNTIIANLTEDKGSMGLYDNMQELEVLVKFNVHSNKSYNQNIWCNNIELFIDYDRW